MLTPDGRLRVAVLGAAGYAGAETLRLFLQHPRVGSVRAFSRSHVGRALGEVHPSLAHLGFARFEEASPGEAAASADVVVLAMEHGQSQAAIDEVVAADPKLVLDLGADFRVRDEGLYRAHYGQHSCFGRVASFAYGLADVEGPRLRAARRIAAPGCFATAALLALRPLAAEGLLDGPAVCFAVTGSSGAGAQPSRATHHPVRAHNLFGYALGGHRHEAEILDRLREWTGREEAACRLIPHSGPFVRGIHATVHARLSRPVGEAAALCRAAYEGRPFVRVLGTPPELSAVVGTNFAHLHAMTRDRGREAVLTVAIDNLVKGAAGQAVQAMNLALGFDEKDGLSFPGMYPC